MNSLYEQVNFILSGGALRTLVEFLTPKVGIALIASPQGEDLEILDAVGVGAADLFLKGWAPKLASVFPERAKNEKFEVKSAPFEGDWPWAIRISGLRWTFYVLLREAPSEAMLKELYPVAGLVALWQAFQHIEVTEERLSRTTYMILTTKNTLASIFEPMPLEYYASFLAGVLKESLFPRELSIFRDDGAALSRLEGSGQPPAREGIYAKPMLPPAPVVTKKDSAPYEVVLPIMEPYHLFCVTKWDKMPEEETLDFLELVSNLASRALSINRLRTENTTEKERLSSEEFTVLSLSEALSALKSQKDRQSVLSMSLDIFSELTQAEECLLVSWDGKGYIPAEYHKNGMKPSFNKKTLSVPMVTDAAEPSVFDLKEGKFSALFNSPWPEMSGMKRVFPIWDRGRMEAFIAISSIDASELAMGDKLPALKIIAQFAAFVMRNFA